MSRQGRQINFWVDSDLWERLNDRAVDLGMTRTAYFNKLITKELDSHFLSGQETVIDIEGSLMRFREEIEEEMNEKFEALRRELSRGDQLRQVTQSVHTDGKDSSSEIPTLSKGYLDNLPSLTRTSVEPVLTVFQRMSGALTRKQIAEKLGTSENSIRRPLDRLQSDGVVTRKREGRSFEYILNR